MGLSITRRLGESVFIGEGDDEIRVTVTRIKGGEVKLNIDAPRKMSILREELRARDQEKKT